MSHTLLIIDDEKNIRRALGLILAEPEFRLLEAGSAEEGLDLLRETPIDLVLLDLNLPGMNGLEALKVMRREQPETTVVMISGQSGLAEALEATREGAFDFLEKPLSRERVLVAVRNALAHADMGREVRAFKAREADRHTLLGASPVMRRLLQEILTAAPTNARILILGESGTGKELVARAVHERSARRDRAFVRVNCAAIPEELIESELFGAVKGAFTGATATRDGKFLQADGGTLFLDEIADMSLKAQAKVLRALQEGEIERVGGSETLRVDVRVLAATNKELRAEVAAGRFREDLFFRLSVVPLQVPPLRERGDDIILLAEHFLERYRHEYSRPARRLSPSALEWLRRHPWPGNVRELQNAVERMVLMARGAEIEAADLEADRPAPGGAATGAPPGSAGAAGEAGASGATADAPPMTSPMIRALPPAEVQRVGGLAEARRLFEAACIRECLQSTGGNVSEAARILSIDRTNLHKKILSLGLAAPDAGRSS